MNEAENLMKSLIDQSQSIENVADVFVTKFPELVYELSKVIDQWFNKSNMDKKNTCIELVCLIMKKSLQRNCQNNFVKGLAQRLRFFLQDLSRNYISEGVALNVGRNIESLKFIGIFGDQYFEKLQQLTKKIKENSNPINQSEFLKSSSFERDQKSYSRTFLMEYEKINEYAGLKSIYDTFIEFNKNENQVNQSKGSDVDDFTARFEDTFSLGGKSFSEINSSSLEGKRERLEHIIEQCHSHILLLRQSMREEMGKYEENFGLYQAENGLESQYSIAE